MKGISDNMVKIKAPAKVNLTLDVVGRRPDGYHDLRTVMQTIDIYDEVRVLRVLPREADGYFSADEKDGIRVRMNKELPDEILPEENIAYKAALLMKKKFGIGCGFDIYIEKNIPAAAGLAGGSADCAAALEGINRLCGLSLTNDELSGIGAALGADVPFCVKKGTMLSEGIGEILTPLPPLPPMWILLIKPDVSVSTAKVYARLDMESVSPRPDTDGMVEAIKKGNLSGIARRVSNVLETVTIPKYPIIGELKAFLKENGAMSAIMSGSGPTTYGIFANEKEAMAASEKAKKKYAGFDVAICRPFAC